MLQRMTRPFAKAPLPAAYFPLGGPVPAADLVGREGYIRRAAARLGDGNHILIAGPRRIGKTSVMLEILRRLRRKGIHTAYAFLGSEEGILEQLFSGKGRAFYRFALPLDLADAAGHRFGIDPDDWLSYIREKLSERKLSIADADIDRILDATGGHPQDTMQVCAALYYLMRDAGLRVVTAEAIGVAIEQSLRELQRAFALHSAGLRER